MEEDGCMATDSGPSSASDPSAGDTIDIGRKLTIALAHEKMQSIADRAAFTLRTEVLAKLDAMERATNLWHDDLVRVPTEVQRAVEALRDLLEQTIITSKANFEGQINTLSETVKADKEVLVAGLKRLEDVSEQRFARIDAGLMERDKRADQLALANSAALAAALSAQKEAAAEAQKSAALAIGKSEGATSEAIKQGQTLFQTGLQSLTNQVNDLKSRLDKGEGSRTISDPATETRLAALSATVTGLSSSNERGTGAEQHARESTSFMFSIIIAAGAVSVIMSGLIAVVAWVVMRH